LVQKIAEHKAAKAALKAAERSLRWAEVVKAQNDLGVNALSQNFRALCL